MCSIVNSLSDVFSNRNGDTPFICDEEDAAANEDAG